MILAAGDARRCPSRRLSSYSSPEVGGRLTRRQSPTIRPLATYEAQTSLSLPRQSMPRQHVPECRITERASEAQRRQFAACQIRFRTIIRELMKTPDVSFIELPRRRTGPDGLNILDESRRLQVRPFAPRDAREMPHLVDNALTELINRSPAQASPA